MKDREKRTGRGRKPRLNPKNRKTRGLRVTTKGGEREREHPEGIDLISIEYNSIGFNQGMKKEECERLKSNVVTRVGGVYHN